VSVLGETGLRLTQDELLDYLAAAFARWEAQLVTYGFAPDPQRLAEPRGAAGPTDRGPHHDRDN
jgi:hypothetical protein